MIYFTADLHSAQHRTFQFSRRPFRNVDDMNEKMIRIWNTIVKPEDEVICLGDFGDYNFRQYLNGKVSLALGNYEVRDIDEGKITLDDLTNKYNFDRVFPEDGFLINIEGHDFYCCHKPEDCDMSEFNLFGHVHRLQMIKRFGLNVGVDCHYFKPINLEEILFYKNAIENEYDKNVFM